MWAISSYKQLISSTIQELTNCSTIEDKDVAVTYYSLLKVIIQNVSPDLKQ
jgi:hypothetical protein